MNNNKSDESALLAGCKGVFSKTSYISIGTKDTPEDYVKKGNNRSVFGGKQFATQPPKQGKTVDVLFEKKHNWISDGDKYVDRWRYKEQQTEKKKGFLTSDFSKRDEFSHTVRTEQWREQLKFEESFAKKAIQMFTESAGLLDVPAATAAKQKHEPETFLYDLVYEKEDPAFSGASKTHRDTRNRTMLSHDRQFGGSMTTHNLTYTPHNEFVKPEFAHKPLIRDTFYRSTNIFFPSSPMTTPQACDLDALFRLFTLVPAEGLQARHLLVDTRDQKFFKRGHISQAFCVRVSANGAALVDYSKSEYSLRWSPDVWVGRTVWVYGEEGLKKDHPVVAYAAFHGASAVHYLRDAGFPQFEAAFPFLCTASVKANSYKQYPSQIVAGLLYLGDWGHATAAERLADINVGGVVTIHNHPKNLAPHLAKGVRWLRWELPDVETADISVCFNDTFDFIETARSRNEAVLVHCGAGVSRSATLCCMYLMRRFGWCAQKAKDHCVSRRSVVCPNDGFWRTLCALEVQLGITERSDPNATSGYRGDDAADEPLPALSQDAAGGKVPVKALTAEEFARKRGREEVQEGEEGAPGGGALKRPAPDIAARQGVGLVVTLEVRKPEGAVGELVVGPMARNQRVLFGRLPSVDVVLEHASISRQHAALSTDVTGALHLTDLGSAHGTKLDGVWIKPNVAKPLRKGSMFQLGASTRTYVVASFEQGPLL